MCKQSIHLAVTYFPAFYLYETYLLQKWLPRWNQSWSILTQLRFIHNWVIMGIQWMVRWWVRWFTVARWIEGFNIHKVPSKFYVGGGGGGGGAKKIWLAHCYQKNEAMEAPQNRRLMYMGPPHRPCSVGERRIIFAKAYGMKVRCL
jgi:hypothetical protein